MAKVNKMQWKMMLKACSMEGKDVPMLSREQQNPPLSKMLAAKWLNGGFARIENRRAELCFPRSFWEQWKKKVIAPATTSPRTERSPHK